LADQGFDWNTIYDMQANGTWTWAALEDIAGKMTKYLNNDGNTDIYGLIGSADDFHTMAVYTNGGSFFAFDENGELTINVNSQEAINALNWSKKVWNEYSMPTPDGAKWDWYKDTFKAGTTAFYMYQTYGGYNDNAELADTDFDWGCVAFPVPEEGGNYIHIANDTFVVIPNVYDDPELIAQMCFIYDLYTDPTPGYDDEYAWIGNKYNYTDDRAVEETYAMLREAEHTVAGDWLYLGTRNDVMGNNLLWALWREPAEVIEESTPAWQALCDNFNHPKK
ncbi:MAG: hypothetical protein II920_05725, partial [Clostridia bacterium]|nr:hypothetical protein [Clostridia bacterium]